MIDKPDPTELRFVGQNVQRTNKTRVDRSAIKWNFLSINIFINYTREKSNQRTTKPVSIF